MLNASRLFPVFMILTTTGLPVRGQQAELRTLASGLAEDIQASGKKTIAVVDFTDLQGNPTELGRYLAEELSVAMARTHKGFEVIDRAHLKAILTEHKLTASGLIDPATAKKLGQISGADVLLTGTMTPFSESVRIAVKALATDTARIIGADTAELPKTATIIELIGHGVGGKDASSGAPPSRAVNDSGTGSAPQPSNPVVMIEEFQYEILSCKGVANSVRCRLRITNRGPDRWLSQSCFKNPYSVGSTGTRAYDNLGNESAGESCSISNHGSDMGAHATLVSGVPVEASVLFQTLSPSATTLSLITISAQTGPSGKGFYVSFRGVPITR
jgi:TolB-like protein